MTTILNKTDLTHRENEVLSLLALGYSRAELAAELYITMRTVDFHIGRAYCKLGASNRLQALIKAGLLGGRPAAIDAR